jgi:hypothetical protein
MQMDEEPIEDDQAEDGADDGHGVSSRLFGDNDSRDAWEWAQSLEDDDDLSELTLEG